MTKPRAVPARFHQDGWTPDVQAVFLDALMTSGSVREAARACGKTASAAYRLRAHANGAGFKAGWEAAIDVCCERVRETAIDRAFNGRMKAMFRNGVQTHEELVFNDRLLMTLMRLYDAPLFHARHAAAALAALHPPVKPLKTQAEQIAEIEAIFEDVRVKHAAREAEAAQWALEDAAGAAAAAGAAGADETSDPGVSNESRKADAGSDPGVSNESRKADGGSDPGVSNESRKADDAVQLPPDELAPNHSVIPANHAVIPAPAGTHPLPHPEMGSRGRGDDDYARHTGSGPQPAPLGLERAMPEARCSGPRIRSG